MDTMEPRQCEIQSLRSSLMQGALPTRCSCLFMRIIMGFRAGLCLCELEYAMGFPRSILKVVLS